MTFALAFPAIDPVLIEIGPFAIRWYALAYIAGIVLGWLYMRRLARTSPATIEAHDIDDFLTWATLGVILGGRLGYVLFYQPSFYFAHPGEIIAVWKGGMSFHGGLLGVMVATILFCRRRDISLFHFGDMVAAAAPIGLFFGRVANFINGELFGRVTDAPIGMVFPHGGPLPRHPSQLYEAALEGLVLFLVLVFLWSKPSIRAKAGVISGAMLAGYAVGRFIAEFFREPDPFLGFLQFGATMGQLLSVPMFMGGVAIIWWARRRAEGSTAPRDAEGAE